MNGKCFSGLAKDVLNSWLHQQKHFLLVEVSEVSAGFSRFLPGF
jgi:hypothetical protein